MYICLVYSSCYVSVCVTRSRGVFGGLSLFWPIILVYGDLDIVTSMPPCRAHIFFKWLRTPEPTRVPSVMESAINMGWKWPSKRTDALCALSRHPKSLHHVACVVSKRLAHVPMAGPINICLLRMNQGANSNSQVEKPHAYLFIKREKLCSQKNGVDLGSKYQIDVACRR
jgi:hypothetical protein